MARLLYILLLVSASLWRVFGQGTFQLSVNNLGGVLVTESVGSVQACAELTSGPLASDTTVNLETRDASAIGPDDFAILSEQLTFISGSTSGVRMCRDIQIEQDNLPENIETFNVILTADGSPDRTATVLINDDDVPVIGLEESSYSVNESDGVVTVCAVLQPQGAGLGRELRFNFAVQDGSATRPLPRDYIFSETLQTLSPTISRLCTNISITSDLIVEDTEFFTTFLESNNNAIINGSAIVHIVDVAGAAISIQETDISITEGTSGQICIVLENGVLERNVSVTLTTTAGTAGVNDFSPLVNAILTIPSTAAVSTAVCLNITVSGDMFVEDNETFTITVETSNSNDVIMGPSTATATIVDDDSATISIQETLSIMEGTSGQICIVLEDIAGGLERAVSVTLMFTPGGFDFELTDIVVTFPSTAVINDTMCRNITAIDDIILEGDEMFTITVVASNPNDVVGLNMATVTVQDNGNDVVIPTLQGPISPGDDDGRTIGIAVGVSVGVTLLIIVLLIIIVAVYIAKRRKQQQKYVLPNTVYSNPETGGGTASSVEDVTDVQPVKDQPPPDYDEVVGEGDANGRESVVIEPAVVPVAAVDGNASDGAEAASDDEIASTNELIDEDVTPEKSELTFEEREIS